MKRFLVAVFLLLGAGRAGAQADSCLALWQDIHALSGGIPHDTAAWMNPDSLKFDTCSSDSTYYFFSGGSASYRHPFARKYFNLIFHYYVLQDTGVLIGDTVYRDWRDIDTSYPDIRNGFEAVERRFGPFSFQHVRYDHDTSGFTRRDWNLIFDKYVYADSALAYLRKTAEWDTTENGVVRLSSTIMFFSGIRQDHLTFSPSAWPVPCDRELFIGGVSKIDSVQLYDALGRATTIRSEITSDPLSLDVSKFEPGVYYLRVNQRLFKILILR